MTEPKASNSPFDIATTPQTGVWERIRQNKLNEKIGTREERHHPSQEHDVAIQNPFDMLLPS